MLREILEEEEEEKDELGKPYMAPLVCPPEVVNIFSLTIFPLEEIIKRCNGSREAWNIGALVTVAEALLSKRS